MRDNPKQVILAEYFVGEQATLLFIGRRGAEQPVVVELPVARSALQALIDSSQALEATAPDTSTWRQASWLAQWQSTLLPLVQPLVDHTAPGDVVWFVPHDLLHYFPLHAVQIENAALIERNPVCYTPSASVLKYCRERTRCTAGPALIVADTRPDAPLPHALQQALLMAADAAEGSVLLRGAAATKQAVVDHLLLPGAAYCRIHFGCHGIFLAESPLRSGIQLARSDPAKSPVAQTFALDADCLTAEEIFGLPASADLAVLSACDTGLSIRQAGDELIGLTRAILYAWAPSVVVSLWQVDEISTSLLMTEFYLGLRRGLNKAQALQQAQVHVMRLSAQAVIDACLETQQALVGIDQQVPADRIALDIADLCFWARDYQVALDAYRKLAAKLVAPEMLRQVQNCCWRCETMLLGAPPPLRYDERPFADLYYWAAFLLVGDWL